MKVNNQKVKEIKEKAKESIKRTKKKESKGNKHEKT